MRWRTDVQGMPFLDPEKAATTTATGHRVYGVKLSSRYSKHHEYDAMIRALGHLSPSLRSRITSIWCDSKACATYTVEGDVSQADLDLIGLAFFETCGGHNGISGPNEMVVDPDWGEDP